MKQQKLTTEQKLVSDFRTTGLSEFEIFQQILALPEEELCTTPSGRILSDGFIYIYIYIYPYPITEVYNEIKTL